MVPKFSLNLQRRFTPPLEDFWLFLNLQFDLMVKTPFVDFCKSQYLQYNSGRLTL